MAVDAAHLRPRGAGGGEEVVADGDLYAGDFPQPPASSPSLPFSLPSIPSTFPIPSSPSLPSHAQPLGAQQNCRLLYDSRAAV